MVNSIILPENFLKFWTNDIENFIYRYKGDTLKYNRTTTQRNNQSYEVPLDYPIWNDSKLND